MAMQFRSVGKAQRRHGQWSLRWFLVFCIGAGTFGSWLASHGHTVARAHLAVSAIERAGSAVNSDFYERYGLFPLARKSALASWCEWTLARPDELFVQFRAGVDADRIIELAGALPSLRCMTLMGTNVSDTGLARLPLVRGLQEVRLQRTAISDEGLVHLAKLSGVRRLDLSGTDITDAGLVHLQKLSSLQELCLANTRITSAGVESLRQVLPHLTILTRGGVPQEDRNPEAFAGVTPEPLLIL